MNEGQPTHGRDRAVDNVESQQLVMRELYELEERIWSGVADLGRSTPRAHDVESIFDDLGRLRALVLSGYGITDAEWKAYLRTVD